MNDFDETAVVELLVVARAARTALDVAIAAPGGTLTSNSTAAVHRLIAAVARLDRAAVALLRSRAVDDSRSDVTVQSPG